MYKISQKRLGDIVNFKRGYDLPSYNRIDGKYPIISSSGVSGYHSEFKAEGEGLVTGRYGTLGEMYYISGKYWPHNTALYATDFKGNYPKYVYYLMKCLGNLKTSDKSTVPGINRNDLHEINVPYINPEHQKPLADFLYLIDSKIELNNRINAELETMAKILYNYWFVQFDFPDADGKPYKSRGGKMVWNEELKRQLPEGWETVNLGRLLSKDTTTKKIPASEIMQEGAFPVIDQSVSYISGFTNEVDAIIKCDVPRIIFGDHTRVLKLINFDFARGADGTQVILSNNPRMPQHLLYHSLMKIDLSNKGYARHFKFLKDVPLVLPDIHYSERFDNTVNPYFKKIRHNIFENKQLSDLRDWLLPMLMNGQVKAGGYAAEEEEEEQSYMIAAESEVEYGKGKK